MRPIRTPFTLHQQGAPAVRTGFVAPLQCCLCLRAYRRATPHFFHRLASLRHLRTAPSWGCRVGQPPAAVLQLAVPITTPTGTQLAYLLEHGLAHLFDAAADQQIQLLTTQQEDGGVPGMPHSNEALTMEQMVQRQIQAVRQAEQRRIAEEVVYLWCAHKLLQGNMQLAPSLQALGQQQQVPLVNLAAMHSILHPAVVDATCGLVGSAFGDLSADMPGSLITRVDRTQAAQLYAGNAEYGYFVRGMAARCTAAGVPLGQDSAKLVEMAGSLSQDELRASMMVATQEAWHAVVRHVGHLFQLPPRPESAPADPDSLPFPQLSRTVSSAQVAPAAYMSEHYSPPGAAQAASAKVASKQARGWEVHPDELPENLLPEPDLVAFQLDALKQVLLEAAVLGCIVWEAEHSVKQAGYSLTMRTVAPAAL
ncbi:hypothetical protein WJX72_004282 [[Myrmecia] bisecta]|uniref:Uncharacterized protein n=1 Tax=[Myrmecia] bisecta TaxID=41462 RepID=A0AAW1R678_9CHLO